MKIWINNCTKAQTLSGLSQDEVPSINKTVANDILNGIVQIVVAKIHFLVFGKKKGGESKFF